ncbi:MAG: insulinase family protein [Rhodobiaceae bacterium]|nr:insulinase family protein [Rhodobiaceae bacterium]
MRGGAVALCLGLAVLATDVRAEAPAEPPLFAPQTETFTLDNGMQVVVIPDHRVPVVTHMVWYRAGAADEKPGVSGVAHFLEHLMFKGTEEHPDGEFSRIVSEIGGQENAFTTQDYTGYFQRVSRDHLGEMMALEADRMRNLRLTENDISTEREVIIEERRQRVENDPGSILSEALMATFYENSPYGTPVIGWKQEMESLGRDAVLAFYKQFYAPEKAILIVAGDVSTDEVRDLAQKTYGQIPRVSETYVRERPQEPPHLTEETVTLRDARVRQPSMQQAYLVPSYTTAKPGEAEALDILAEVLGGGSTSRIYQDVVVKQKLAAGAGAWYQSSAIDDTRFGVYGTPTEGTDLKTLEAAIEKVIADVSENGVTQEEVDRARNSMLAEAIFAQDSQATLARAFGSALASGETVKDVQEWPRRIMNVTPADVQAAAQRYLDPDTATTGYLLPKKAEGRS